MEGRCKRIVFPQSIEKTTTKDDWSSAIIDRAIEMFSKTLTIEELEEFQEWIEKNKGLVYGKDVLKALVMWSDSRMISDKVVMYDEQMKFPVETKLKNERA
jgi:nicotinic acid mononucleotide adenylyltransferase